MPKKQLLNETQVRQFMKLASLEPLTPGFVEGLTKNTKDIEESHGRGRDEGAAGYGHPDANSRLEEDEESELHATEDELGQEEGGDKKGDQSEELDYEKNESAKATDELVEAITKRVAARILKTALAKK
mgnify:CR=1 FL=1